MRLSQIEFAWPPAMADLRVHLADRFGHVLSRAEFELGLGAVFWTMLIVFIVRSGE